MFERKLEDFALKSVVSLTDRLYTEFCDIVGDSNVFKFEDAYDKITAFFSSNELHTLYDKYANTDIQYTLSHMKPIIALYCCYFAMDYIYRQENPAGEQLNYDFIRKFYDCPPGAEESIYKSLTGSKKTIYKVKQFEDAMIMNPALFKRDIEKCVHINEGSGKSKRIPHIYSGNIIRYLDKTCQFGEKNIVINDLAPSVTLIALKAGSALPNGDYVNRSSKISSNSIIAVDKWVLGEEIGYENENTNIPLVRWDKINYDTDSNISELINLAVIDDVYKLDRVNRALYTYITFIEKYKLEESSEIAEWRAASACSLLLFRPHPTTIDDELAISCLLDYLKDEDVTGILSYSYKLLTFNAFTFPYLTGLMCYTLFYQEGNIKSLIDIKEIVKDLEKEIQENDNLLQNYFGAFNDRIWNYQEGNDLAMNYIIKTATNKGKSIHHGIDWKRNHIISFDKILNIMLSQTTNLLKTRVYLDENFTRASQNSKQNDLKKKYFNTCLDIKKQLEPETYIFELASQLKINLLGE